MIGVIGGWVAAVAAIIVIAAAWIGLPGAIAGERSNVRPMIKFFVGVAVYLALFNALMFVDTWLVKRLTAEYYEAHAGLNTEVCGNTLLFYRHGKKVKPHQVGPFLADGLALLPLFGRT